jgi:glycogen debranching enzyme
VQAYVFGAKRGASRLATVVGQRDRSRALLGEARLLRSRFEATFWCEDLATYAIALDGDKRPCRVRSSNAGHCLFTGIASPTRARLVAATLTHPDMFSGWGVRTIASDARRYNPMSYHNGSVWPHDNALIAAGMGRYHLSHQAEKILQGLYDACQWVDLQRLPELVCGFERVPAPARRSTRSRARRRRGRPARSTCSWPRVSASRSTVPSNACASTTRASRIPGDGLDQRASRGRGARRPGAPPPRRRRRE